MGYFQNTKKKEWDDTPITFQLDVLYLLLKYFLRNQMLEGQLKLTYALPLHTPIQVTFPFLYSKKYYHELGVIVPTHVFFHVVHICVSIKM